MATTLSSNEEFLKNVGFDKLAFSIQLPCFPCIMNDFIYCQNAPDHAHVELGQEIPQGVCCESKETCAQQTLPGWTCSDSYSDKLLSLRICPFEHSKCGNQSEIVFNSPGSNLNQNLTFYPSDVCFFTIRTECGIPSFNPQGLEMASGVDIYTIEYDDQDVDPEVVNVNETDTSIPDPLSNSTMKPKIPLPKKKENFDGHPKNISQSEPYLLRYQVNDDGTTSYFYSNGSVFSYETTTTITYSDPKDTKSYEVQYLNGTKITVNKDGSKVISVPGQVPQTILAPTPPPPSTPMTTNYNYEDSIGGRRLQTTKITTSQPWGTVVFYFDGRVRELLADGTVKEDLQYYIVPANSTSNQTLNNSYFLKIRVYTNGSYIEYWSSGKVNDYTRQANWNQYYFIKKPEYARQIIISVQNQNGSFYLSFLNQTSRYIYPPLTRLNTTFQNATAINYDDIQQSQQSTQIKRYYFNGTVALFTNQQFSSFIVAPSSFAKDWKRVNFTDGSYVIYYETQQRKVYYPPPPITGVESTYTIAISILSIEETVQGTTRVVFRNGTIINKNNTDGTIIYEVQPTYLFPTSETKNITYCQYQVFDYVNDVNTVYYCPPDKFTNANFNATGPKANTTLRDGSKRVEYLNGTIARFYNNNSLINYEVPPKSFYYEFDRIMKADGSSFIDYRPINNTRREFPPPLSLNATQMMIACSIKYSDVFLSNSTSRVYYINNTVAIFNKGLFVSYEVPPQWLFGGCIPGQYYDGRPMQNCSGVNQTLIVFHPPLTYKNTQYENATAANKDIVFSTNSSFIRFFYNGSIAIYQDLQQNGSIKFLNWTLPPSSFYQIPLNYRIQQNSDGSKSIFYNNLTSITYAADLNINSTIAQNVTGWVVRVKDPVANQTRIHYRNGSVGIEWFNGTNSWLIPPQSYFVPYVQTIQVDGSKNTQWDDGRYTYEKVFPLESATDYEKATAIKQVNGFPNKTEIITYFNGSVAENRNGFFYNFIIPPKSFFVEVTSRLNSDGSNEKFFSNGTTFWYAAPASKNETTEQFALRVIMIEYFNGSKTQTFANGTVVIYQPNGQMKILVPPKSLLIMRRAVTQPDGGLIEYFSNGTTRITAGPVDDRLDDVEKARFVVIDENYSVEKSRKVYLNGTIANFFKGKLVGYEVKPTSYFYGCVQNETMQGLITQKCWNDTIRSIYPPLPETASEEQRALGIKYQEQTLGGNTTTVFYLNGTISVQDIKNGSFLYYLNKPESLFVSFQTSSDSKGNKQFIYSNGTIMTVFRPPSANASLYQNATSPAWNKTFSNGTFETKFNNGTHIKVDVNGTNVTIVYIQKAEEQALIQDGDKVVVKMQNNSTRTYFPRPPPSASDYDKKTAPNYRDAFDNGTVFIKFYNGSYAQFLNGSFVEWTIKPEYYLEDVNRTDYQDGSYQVRFIKDNTVIYYFAPLPDTASEKERALALVYVEKFMNGTIKRAFLNGTIAVFYNNVLVRYDVKPKEFYKESNIDQPFEEKAADGSKKVFFSNGTVKYFQATNLNTDKLYMDCFTNLTCISFYKNGTKLRYDDDVFVSQEDPSAPEPKDPHYNYVDKSGPKIQAYDKAQGGIKKYKEDYQNSDARAQKSEPNEPICKGRNQMIIIGDHRIKKSVYNSSRLLQNANDEGPAIIALQLESAFFNKDSISSAKRNFVSTIVTIFAFSIVFM